MEHTSFVDDDVELRLPPEFLTDDDFLVEKENKLFKGDESNLFPYELSHGFGLDSGFGRTTKPIRDEDDFYGGFGGNHAFPADNNNKAWGATRSSPCGARDGYGRGNQNCQARVSSQAEAWDLYCAAVEKLATMNIGDGYNSGMGIVDRPIKHPLAAAAVENPNDYGGGYYYSRQSLQYHQKLQALQFQQQQQLQRSRGLKVNTNKIATNSPSVWSHQPQRSDGSGMRAVFLAGKRGSTGTGVFLPRRVNPTSPETRENPSVATVLIPARVAEVLNLDESVVQPSVRPSVVETEELQWRILESDEDGANSD
ncbi:hypothetical protein HA466_0174920 [Hirschfeldia incana]|nr:hypothetical protein HA466_0174920 [Hirschfeldia incana]